MISFTFILAIYIKVIQCFNQDKNENYSSQLNSSLEFYKLRNLGSFVPFPPEALNFHEDGKNQSQFFPILPISHSLVSTGNRSSVKDFTNVTEQQIILPSRRVIVGNKLLPNLSNNRIRLPRPPSFQRKDFYRPFAKSSRIIEKELNFNNLQTTPPFHLPFKTRYDNDFIKEFQNVWKNQRVDDNVVIIIGNDTIDDNNDIIHDPLLDIWDGVLILENGIVGDHLGKEASLIIAIFVGIYILVALFFKDAILEPKCLYWDENVSYWEFHAFPRFVPSPSSDPQIQHELLDLFRVMKRHRNDQESSSSEEDSESITNVMSQFSNQLSHINEMCPRESFFVGLAPRHNDAIIALQQLFVGQKTVTDLFHVAKSILISQKINPKVWYLALMAASLERNDMMGFNLPHPIDAMPDLFIPGHLIQYDLNKQDGFDKNWRIEKNVNSTQLFENNKKQNSQKIRKKKNKTIKQSSSNKLKSRIARSTKLLPEKSTMTKTSWKAYKISKNKSKIKSDDGHKITFKKFKHDRGRKEVKKKKCIVVDDSIGIENGPENVLAYFREDMMLNQHHLYWHQIYPLNSTRHGDRRAELFFFMHRAMLARYNAERLSNGLGRVQEQTLDHGSVIVEGYNSHLADVNSGKFWTPRPSFTPVNDIIHENDPDIVRNIFINHIHALTQRFNEAIRNGHLLSKQGGKFSIYNNDGNGINVFGDTLEASELSINPLYYDAFGLHNLGHQLIALLVDPKFEKGLPVGIMSDASVSMRDPSFYTYHTFIDNLFERYKESLTPYGISGGAYPLTWRGVEIINVELYSERNKQHAINEIRTFFTKKRFELTGGVDGSVDKGENVDICATHLNHEPFQFRITIDRKPCTQSKSGIATIRLMMAPRFDENGQRLSLIEQRRLIFPLDTFQVDLKVGRNIITRRSQDSSLTVPWSKTLKEMEYQSSDDSYSGAEYCGCGWPKHLYIPKGNEKGMTFDLFIMITNYDHDYVPDDPRDLDIPEGCNSAYIFCGRPHRRYPDSKPMMYPFDRPLPGTTTPFCHFGDVFCKLTRKFRHKRPPMTMEEYVFPVPNMAMISFDVRHISKKFKGMEDIVMD